MTSHFQNFVNNWPWLFEIIQFECTGWRCSTRHRLINYYVECWWKPDISYRYRSSWRHKWCNDDVIVLMTYFSDQNSETRSSWSSWTSADSFWCLQANWYWSTTWIRLFDIDSFIKWQFQKFNSGPRTPDNKKVQFYS